MDTTIFWELIAQSPALLIMAYAWLIHGPKQTAEFAARLHEQRAEFLEKLSSQKSSWMEQLNSQKTAYLEQIQRQRDAFQDEIKHHREHCDKEKAEERAERTKWQDQILRTFVTLQKDGGTNDS